MRDSEILAAGFGHRGDLRLGFVFVEGFVSHRIYHRGGSNQDADAWRDQAVDREREDEARRLIEAAENLGSLSKCAVNVEDKIRLKNMESDALKMASKLTVEKM